MEFKTSVRCSKCQQLITSGEGPALVCFKIPGREVYQFFHYRFRVGDCWEIYLRERK